MNFEYRLSNILLTSVSWKEKLNKFKEIGVIEFVTDIETSQTKYLFFNNEEVNLYLQDISLLEITNENNFSEIIIFFNELNNDNISYQQFILKLSKTGIKEIKFNLLKNELILISVDQNKKQLLKW